MKQKGNEKIIVISDNEGDVSLFQSLLHDLSRRNMFHFRRPGEIPMEKITEKNVIIISGEINNRVLIEFSDLRLKGMETPALFISDNKGGLIEEITGEDDLCEIILKNELNSVSLRMAIRYLLKTAAQKKAFREQELSAADNGPGSELFLLSNAMKAVANSVIITDKRGDIVWVNKGFEKLTGYNFSEVKGKNPRILQSGKHDEHFFEFLWATVNRGEVWNGVIINRKKNGVEYYEKVSITPVIRNSRIENFISVGEDISKKKMIDEKLVYERKLLQILMESVPDAIYFKDLTARFIRINNAQMKNMGISRREEAIGKSDYDFLPEKFAAKSYNDDLRVLMKGEAIIAKEEKLEKDGEVTWWLATKVPWRNDSDEIIGLIGITRNITVRKQAQIQNENVRQIFEFLYEMSKTRNFDEEEIIHRILKRALNLTESEFSYLNYIGKDGEIYPILTCTDNQDRWERFENEVLEIGKYPLIWQRCIDEAGPFISNNFTKFIKSCGYYDFTSVVKKHLSVPIFDAGRLVALCGICNKTNNYQSNDILYTSILISEMWKLITYKRAEEKLRVSEKRFRNLYQNATVGIYRVSKNGDIQMANPRLVEMFGYDTEEEMIENFESDYGNINKEVREEFIQLLERSKIISGYESKWITPGGDYMYLRESAKAFRDDEGKLIFYEGTVENITSQVEMINELIDSESKYRALIENSNDAVIIFSGEMIKYSNSRFEELFSDIYEEAELNEPFIKQFFGNENFDLVWNCVSSATSSRDSFVYTTLTREGKSITFEALISKVILEESTISQIILRDISEKIHYETQLRHLQKMEAIGTLAAGIAHEINTPTQFVGDNLTFLKESFSSYSKIITRLLEKNDEEQIQRILEDEDYTFLAEEIPEALEQSKEGINRISSIVSAMREFAHGGVKTKIETDIHRNISNTITVTRNEWKYCAEIHTDFDSSLPPVKCLINEINQVLVNLIVNAAHAIKEKYKDSLGNIVIKTGNFEDHIKIMVSDDGTGIPQDIRERIFDPFFTTKEVGVGSGQGLAIAYSIIVDKHDGKLYFETEEDKGTTFIIELPKI